MSVRDLHPVGFSPGCACSRAGAVLVLPSAAQESSSATASRAFSASTLATSVADNLELLPGLTTAQSIISRTTQAEPLRVLWKPNCLSSSSQAMLGPVADSAPSVSRLRIAKKCQGWSFLTDRARRPPCQLRARARGVVFSRHANASVSSVRIPVPRSGPALSIPGLPDTCAIAECRADV